MRQLFVVQDWGYNKLYLHHNNRVIKVNLDNHSYRDITKTPVEDFEATLYDPQKEHTDDTTSEEGAWLCDLFERASMIE